MANADGGLSTSSESKYEEKEKGVTVCERALGTVRGEGVREGVWGVGSGEPNGVE